MANRRFLYLVDEVKAIFGVFIIRVWGDLAKMVGYPVGVLWRLRHPDVLSPDHP